MKKVLFALLFKIYLFSQINIPKDFELFLYKFENDSTFQKSHIVFPLMSIQLNWGTLKKDTSYVNVTNHKHMKYILPKSEWTMFQNGFKTKNTYTNELIYTKKGKENGALDSYYFKRIKDEWYLVAVYGQ